MVFLHTTCLSRKQAWRGLSQETTKNEGWKVMEDAMFWICTVLQRPMNYEHIPETWGYCGVVKDNFKGWNKGGSLRSPWWWLWRGRWVSVILTLYFPLINRQKALIHHMLHTLTLLTGPKTLGINLWPKTFQTVSQNEMSCL